MFECLCRIEHPLVIVFYTAIPPQRSPCRKGEQQLGDLSLFSSCRVLTSSPGMCCLYRKIIQEASFPYPCHELMVSVYPSEPQFQMQSLPCHMETECTFPGTFDPVFSKHLIMLPLSVTSAFIIACFSHFPCHRQVLLHVYSLSTPFFSPLLFFSRSNLTASLEDPDLLYTRHHSLYT